jgi:hypothetical protein
MLSWNRLNARFGVTPALLGFNRDARPAADEWLAAFTAAFTSQQNVALPAPARGAARAAHPLLVMSAPPRAGGRPGVIYTATGPILAAAYQTLIHRRAEPRDAPAGRASPGTLATDPARAPSVPAESRPREGGHE